MTELLAAMGTLVPPVTEQFPPLLIESVTLAVMASQLLGLVTVIVPLAVQPLSVTPVWVTVIV